MIYVLIGLVLLEIILRHGAFRNCANMGRSIMLKEHVPNQTTDYKCRLLDKSELTLQTDSSGFIVPNFIKGKSDEIITIAFLGGSVLECFWASPDKRVPVLVAKRLSDHTGKSVRVLNACVSGANSHHSLNSLINKIIYYKPKYIFISHCVNDAGILSQAKSYKGFSVGRLRLGTVRAVLYASHVIELYRHIRKVFNHKEEMHPQKDFGNITIDPEPFKDRLRMIVAVCKAMKITPMLCTQSYFRKITTIQKDEEKTFMAGLAYMDEFNEAVRETTVEVGCELIDLAKLVPQSHLTYYDWIHFTDKGCSTVAYYIWEHMKGVVG